MSIVVSVHVPKCAGTSLLNWLIIAYGEEQVLRDYGDRPLDPSMPMNLDPYGFLTDCTRTSAEIPPGTRLIHGHFWVRKYETVNDAIFVTFLRDPITRSLSHYLHWKRMVRASNPLQHYVQDKVSSWLKFLRLPVIAGVYKNTFFNGFDMSRFSFIGDANDIDSEIRRFGNILGFEHSIPNINKMTGADAEEVGNLLADRNIIQEARALLADEISFYEQYAGR